MRIQDFWLPACVGQKTGENPLCKGARIHRIYDIVRVFKTALVRKVVAMQMMGGNGIHEADNGSDSLLPKKHIRCSWGLAWEVEPNRPFLLNVVNFSYLHMTLC